MSRLWHLRSLAVLEFIFLLAYPIHARASDPGDIGPFTVGHTSFITVNEEVNRPISVDIWYPADADAVRTAPEATYAVDPYFNLIPLTTSSAWEALGIDRAYQEPAPSPGHFPLVLLSPGHGVPSGTYVYAGTRIASHGYVVAQVNHYAEGWFPWEPLDVFGIAVFNRPRDVSFAITKLLERNSTSGDLLYQTMLPDKIAVVGHSYGGYTALVLAGGDDLVCDAKNLIDWNGDPAPASTCFPSPPDPRVKVIVSLDGSSDLLHFEELKRIQIPTLAVGEGPEITSAWGDPWAVWQARQHAAISSNTSLRVDVGDSTHLAFSNLCEHSYVLYEMGIYSRDFFDFATMIACDANLNPWADVHRVATKYAVAFLKTHLDHEAGYQPFLTPGFADQEPIVQFLMDEQCQDQPELEGSPYFPYRLNEDDRECQVGRKDPSEWF